MRRECVTIVAEEEQFRIPRVCL